MSDWTLLVIGGIAGAGLCYLCVWARARRHPRYVRTHRCGTLTVSEWLN